MYKEKTIQNLKPNWYMILSGKEKQKLQLELQERRKKEWANKPKPLSQGTVIVAKADCNSLTKGKHYRVRSYFATLITTIYSSDWNEFVTLKNKYGFTVKMNLNKFENRDFLKREF